MLTRRTPPLKALGERLEQQDGDRQASSPGSRAPEREITLDGPSQRTQGRGTARLAHWPRVVVVAVVVVVVGPPVKLASMTREAL